jgi:site-specific DNA-methyltransferase (cytosine-N4-specific)
MPRTKLVSSKSSIQSDDQLRLAYRTKYGKMLMGSAEGALRSQQLVEHKGQVQLIFTSPPFPLNRKKQYGNLQGDKYIEWLASFAQPFREMLREDGSIVMELGNAWEPGRPVMSTLALRALLTFLDEAKLALCQQFICFNPARLPSPVQWVNIERIRVKDSYTHLWWMAPSDRPNADNRRVLTPYSPQMVELLASRSYNSGKRPSGHSIGEASFAVNNGGAIPSNVVRLTNTASVDPYLAYCRKRHLTPHPARMPTGLPEFFIKFLSTPRALVVDPFAGSNTTGAVAEKLKRRWLSVEPNAEYVAGSLGRFQGLDGHLRKNSSLPRA